MPIRGIQGALAAVLAATLLAAPAHAEEGPSRDAYAVAVEPICERGNQVGKRALRGVRGKVKRRRLRAAGRHFFRASKSYGKTIRRLVAVPRPPADEGRLQRWFGFLRKVKLYLHRVGVALREGDRVKAGHEGIRAERSGNAANNVSSAFPFRHCRLSRSQFRGV